MVNRTRFGIWIPVALLLAIPASLRSAAPLTLRIASEDTPAGGWVQVKVYATEPRQITSGALTMDFDPAVFGSISSTAVFSATGDAQGYAHVSAQHLDAHFWSPSGTIGQLPGMPVFVVSISVQANASTGTTSSLTLDPSGAPGYVGLQSGPAWNDLDGNPYSVSVSPTTFRVGGSMSIQDVSPGGGLIPAGTGIQIRGAGFDPSTVATIDGLALASMRLVNSQVIEATLGSTAELTGRRLHLANASGAQTDHFLALPSTGPSASPTLGPFSDSTLHVFVPLTSYRWAEFGYPGNYKDHLFFAVQNPTLAPVTVTFFDFLNSGPYYGPSPLQRTITVPAGQMTMIDNLAIRPNSSYGGGGYISSSSGVRITEYIEGFNFVGPATEYVSPPPPSDSDTIASSTGATVAWYWQTGTAPPQSQQVYLVASGSFTVSISGWAQNWLNVSPLQGEGPMLLTLSPKPASLTSGTYTGMVTVTYPLPPAYSNLPSPRIAFPVMLTVTATPPLIAPASSVGLPSNYADTSSVVSQTISISSAGGPTPFTVEVSTDSGAKWLSASPTSGTTPATVTITGDRTANSPYKLTGQVTIRCQANALVLPVGLAPLPHAYFVLPPGGRTYQNFDYVAAYAKGFISTISVETQSGGDWLTAIKVTYPPGLQVDEIQVDADATRLTPGTYQGKVTINGSIQIPVTLNVVAPAVALRATPSSLSLTAPVGQTASTELQLLSPADPGLFTQMALLLGPGAGGSTQIVSSAVPGNLGSYTVPTTVTPAVVKVQVSALQPGAWHGAVVISYDGGSINVPLSLYVTPTAQLPPVLTTVVNSQSQSSAPLSAGEAVRVFGMGIGGAPASSTLDATGNLPTTLADTQLLINGQPARLLYVSASRIDAIVPHELGRSGTASIQVVSNGLQSAVWDLPVGHLHEVHRGARRRAGLGAERHGPYNLNNSRSRRVWARLTGISVCFLSSIRN